MLYIVATPIGNLDDISYRQAKTLSISDIVLAEDTRSYAILRQGMEKRFSFQFNINQSVLSYYKQKEFEKLPDIISYLEEGKTISLVSESGMPLISDPGAFLINTCIRKSIPFNVIPGPSAVDTALVYSGFSAKQYLFMGFFPKRDNDITRFIKKITDISKILKDISIICFESPNRINKTQDLIKIKLPYCKVAICREMTKKYEEIIRYFENNIIYSKAKGEITIFISFK
jgi:16S rRNA (cytidine1402-2'-O)-methyltransferase